MGMGGDRFGGHNNGWNAQPPAGGDQGQFDAEPNGGDKFKVVKYRTQAVRHQGAAGIKGAKLMFFVQPILPTLDYESGTVYGTTVVGANDSHSFTNVARCNKKTKHDTATAYSTPSNSSDPQKQAVQKISGSFVLDGASILRHEGKEFDNVLGSR
jgi:hypothetical protein